MGLTPDLKPIMDGMKAMAAAIEHLATALDKRNEIDSGANKCPSCEQVGRLLCPAHGTYGTTHPGGGIDQREGWQR